jgi:hypothetical protein
VAGAIYIIRIGKGILFIVEKRGFPSATGWINSFKVVMGSLPNICVYSLFSS